jgi:hypothetical protein
MGRGKHQPWPPTDHFEKLLEEMCPTHAYPIKHKLRDCGMMKNFMASGSLTWGMEVDEVPDEGSATHFPGADVVMVIYDGHPSLGVRHMSDLDPGTLAHCGRGCRDAGIYGHKFSNIFVY